MCESQAQTTNPKTSKIQQVDGELVTHKQKQQHITNAKQKNLDSDVPLVKVLFVFAVFLLFRLIHWSYFHVSFWEDVVLKQQRGSDQPVLFIPRLQESQNFRGVRQGWGPPGPTYPGHGKSLYNPYNTLVFMGKLSPRIPREHNFHTMGTLLGVHPIVPWKLGIF